MRFCPTFPRTPKHCGSDRYRIDGWIGFMKISSGPPCCSNACSIRYAHVYISSSSSSDSRKGLPIGLQRRPPEPWLPCSFSFRRHSLVTLVDPWILDYASPLSEPAEYNRLRPSWWTESRLGRGGSSWGGGNRWVTKSGKTNFGHHFHVVSQIWLILNFVDRCETMLTFLRAFFFCGTTLFCANWHYFVKIGTILCKLV